MFDLNKIIDIIKETDKEVIFASEKEPIVLMSMNRYRELISPKDPKKYIFPSEGDFQNIKEEDYPNQVKNSIMPEIGIND